MVSIGCQSAWLSYAAVINDPSTVSMAFHNMVTVSQLRAVLHVSLGNPSSLPPGSPDYLRVSRNKDNDGTTQRLLKLFVVSDTGDLSSLFHCPKQNNSWRSTGQEYIIILQGRSGQQNSQRWVGCSIHQSVPHDPERCRVLPTLQFSQTCDYY